jgi:hypothetical protein
VPAASAFTPKRPAARTEVRVRDPRSRQASIIGGSREREVTEFAVAPDGPFGPIAVTMVTPVAYALSASRNCLGVTPSLAMPERYALRRDGGI